MGLCLSNLKFIFLICIFTISGNLVHSQDYYPCFCLLPEKYAPAVSNVERLPLLSSPGGNTLRVLHFGQERMTNLDIVSESGGVIYTKVRAQEGEEGWVAKKFISMCGQGRVIRQNTSAFKDFDNQEKGTYFYAAEPVIITETKNQKAFAESKDKKRSGWVPLEYLIEGEKEVEYAVELERIMGEPLYEKKVKAMESLKSKSKGSEMLGFIEEQYTYLKRMPPPTVASIASRGTEDQKQSAPPQVSLPQPQKQPTEKVKPLVKERMLSASPQVQTKASAPANAEKPTKDNSMPSDRALASIKGLKREKQTVGNTTYWKNEINMKLVMTNQNTDDFTCYHPFLPLHSTVYIAIPDNAGKIALKVIGNSKENDKLFITKQTANRIFGEIVPEVMEVYYYSK